MPRLSLSPKIISLFLALVVSLIIFSIYSPSLSNGFVNWDDDVHLLENPFVHGWDAAHIREIFSTTVNKIYLPLTALSFAAEYHFAGQNPFVYHLTNLLLHILVSVMVMVLGLRLGLGPIPSALAALVFGIHPIHVESVAWVTERKDVLYSFFYLAAMLSYCSYLKESPRHSVTGRRFSFLVLTFILGLLSMMAKPMALSLPLVLLVLDWWVKRRISVWALLEKFALALFFLPVVWMTYVMHMRTIHFSFPQSILLAVWTYVFPLAKFFWPGDLVLIYRVPGPVASYVFAIAAFAILAVVVFVFRRERWLILALLYYSVSIFFLVRFDQAADTNIVADRFIYLPSLGICLFLGYLCSRLWHQKSRQIYVGAAVVVVLVFLAVKTSAQIRVWENGVSLWEHQRKHGQGVAQALVYNKLGEAYLADNAISQESRERNSEAAVYWLKEAIWIKPDYATAYRNLGKHYLDIGQMSQAEPFLVQAVRSDPRDFEALYLLGRLKLFRGDGPGAMEAFGRSLAINPDNEKNLKRINADLNLIKDPQR